MTALPKRETHAASDTKEYTMTAIPIDPAAIGLPPTEPIDITDYLPDPLDEPSA